MQCSYKESRERLAWTLLSIFGKFDGYIDMGAGEGYMTLTIRAAGVKPSMAIDKDEALRDASLTPNMFFIRDITKFFEMKNTVDVVTCFNVLDSVPGPKIEMCVDNLTRHSDKWVVVGSGLYSLAIEKFMKMKGFHLDALTENLRGIMTINEFDDPPPSVVSIYRRK